jgi:hypothetical protein
VANVQIKSEERRQQEAAVLRSYGVPGRGTPEQREAAAVIVARSQEAMKEGKRYGY